MSKLIYLTLHCELPGGEGLPPAVDQAEVGAAVPGLQRGDGQPEPRLRPGHGEPLRTDQADWLVVLQHRQPGLAHGGYWETAPTSGIWQFLSLVTTVVLLYSAVQWYSYLHSSFCSVSLAESQGRVKGLLTSSTRDWVSILARSAGQWVRRHWHPNLRILFAGKNINYVGRTR